MPITRKNNRNWMFWLTLFVLFCTAVYALRSVLLPFVAGIVIGYLLDPFASRFERWGMNRTLATFLVLFLVAIIVLPAMALLIGVIDEQLGRFINVVPQYIGSFLRKIEPFINRLHESFPNMEPEKIREYMRNNLANTLKLAGGVLRGIITSGFAIFNLISLLLITPFVAFYMLRDWDMFIAKVDSLLPRRSKASIREQARQIDRTLAGFIRGQLSVCVILGTYYSLGLYLVGLDLGLLVGFIAGLISFIPYVGSIVGFLDANPAGGFGFCDRPVSGRQLPYPEAGWRKRRPAPGLGYVCLAGRRCSAGFSGLNDCRAAGCRHRRFAASCD